MKANHGHSCSFCGASEEGPGYLIEVDNGVAICERCVKAITALLKANPETKRLWYPPKQGSKVRRKV